jgi:hypothetical protein
MNKGTVNRLVNYIKDNHLSDWTHVYQTKEMEAADIKATKGGISPIV